MSLAIYKPERQSLSTVDFLKDISNQVKIRDISEEDFKYHLIKNVIGRKNWLFSNSQRGATLCQHDTVPLPGYYK